MLYSLDRFENEWAVLVDEEAATITVLRTELPPAVKVGDMLRLVDGVYTPDDAAKQARLAQILQLQKKLR